MKARLLLFALPILLISSCSGPKDPTFERLEKMNVESITLGEIQISADMVLHNPNPFTCHLKDMYLEIFTENDVKLTEVTQTYNTEMIANEDFILPVLIGFAPAKVMAEKEGLLGSVIVALGQQEVEMRLKGYCTVEVMEISLKVPIEYVESVLLKKV